MMPGPEAVGRTRINRRIGRRAVGGVQCPGTSPTDRRRAAMAAARCSRDEPRGLRRDPDRPADAPARRARRGIVGSTTRPVIPDALGGRGVRRWPGRTRYSSRARRDRAPVPGAPRPHALQRHRGRRGLGCAGRPRLSPRAARARRHRTPDGQAPLPRLRPGERDPGKPVSSAPQPIRRRGRGGQTALPRRDEAVPRNDGLERPRRPEGRARL